MNIRLLSRFSFIPLTITFVILRCIFFYLGITLGIDLLLLARGVRRRVEDRLNDVLLHGPAISIWRWRSFFLRRLLFRHRSWCGGLRSVRGALRRSLRFTLLILNWVLYGLLKTLQLLGRLPNLISLTAAFAISGGCTGKFFLLRWWVPRVCSGGLLW
jgi:hypothetical protein